MDNYAKGVLTVIAATLILISFQLSKTNIIKNAQVHMIEVKEREEYEWKQYGGENRKEGKKVR